MVLLLILGISAFLNNPLTIEGCILTFIVVFATTFTSYNLFGSDVYLPYLMCYFMMIAAPVTWDLLAIRMLSLVFGAVFIVGLNIADADDGLNVNERIISYSFSNVKQLYDEEKAIMRS